MSSSEIPAEWPPPVGRYHARWILPVSDPPVEDGTLVVEDGRITAVLPYQDANAVSLGRAAILPALVNAHTHLEFSDLPEPLGTNRRTGFQPVHRASDASDEPEASARVDDHTGRVPNPSRVKFSDWIRALVGYRRSREADVVDVVRRGRDECWSTGTATIGEIATAGWSTQAFQQDGPRAVVFRELLGLLPEQVDEQVAIACDHLDPRHENGGSSLVRGLSPHAPYSVHPDLYHVLLELAADRGAPVSVHLAETLAELELLSAGTGELVEMLREFGVWRDGALPRGRKPLDYLRPLADVPCGLVVHGNYLARNECGFLAGHPQLSVIVCPRTYGYFRHAGHPWRELLAAGVNVAVGTDSRASTPTLDVWAELQFLHERFPDVSPRTLIEMGTIHGAQALGLSDETGSLEEGKAADLAVFHLDEGGSGDPYQELFADGVALDAACCRGIWQRRDTARGANVPID